LEGKTEIKKENDTLKNTYNGDAVADFEGTGHCENKHAEHLENRVYLVLTYRLAGFG